MYLFPLGLTGYFTPHILQMNKSTSVGSQDVHVHIETITCVILHSVNATILVQSESLFALLIHAGIMLLTCC